MKKPVVNSSSCDVVVIGAGPGGYAAAFRAADQGQRVVLVDHRASLGGVCLNAGCIPSKALLHVAGLLEEIKHARQWGVDCGTPQIHLETLRAWKDQIVQQLTTGLSKMAQARGVAVVRGRASFQDPFHLRVVDTDDHTVSYAFNKAVIATGSEPVRLSSMPDDPRVFYSTEALSLPFVPKRFLVIGGGVIGLEMATIYMALGSCVTLVEAGHHLLAGVDDDLRAVWLQHNEKRLSDVFLQTQVSAARAKTQGIEVHFSNSASVPTVGTYDAVLVCVGRCVSPASLNLPDLQVDQKGFVVVDESMRTNYAHIYAIGDVTGNPMLAHKAAHQGHVAAHSLAGHADCFDVCQIPSIAYTDPEIAWTGLTESACAALGKSVDVSVFPWAALGRAHTQGRIDGRTKLIFDRHSKRLLGAGIVGVHAGDLLGELCLALEMGADATDMARTIHPHPTLCESVGLAAALAIGTCTDLMPPKLK